MHARNKEIVSGGGGAKSFSSRKKFQGCKSRFPKEAGVEGTCTVTLGLSVLGHFIACVMRTNRTELGLLIDMKNE